MNIFQAQQNSSLVLFLGNNSVVNHKLILPKQNTCSPSHAFKNPMLAFPKSKTDIGHDQNFNPNLKMNTQNVQSSLNYSSSSNNIGQNPQKNPFYDNFVSQSMNQKNFHSIFEGSIKNGNNLFLNNEAQNNYQRYSFFTPAPQVSQYQDLFNQNQTFQKQNLFASSMLNPISQHLSNRKGKKFNKRNFALKMQKDDTIIPEQLNPEVKKEKKEKKNELVDFQDGNIYFHYYTNNQPHSKKKQITEGDFLSYISYFKIVKIDEKSITVKNEDNDKLLEISKDIFVNEELNGATQYDLEVICSITELQEILKNCGDSIFQVQFRKQVNNKVVEDHLKEIQFKDLKVINPKGPDAAIKQIANELVLNGGEKRTVIGHLLESDDKFGRSLVKDLTLEGQKDKTRLVDHRSIDYIIYKNVKYSLGNKTGKLTLQQYHDELKNKPKENKIDLYKVGLGDWFSQKAYYKVVSVPKKEKEEELDEIIVVPWRNNQKQISIQRNIIQSQMNSSKSFEKIEKVSKSEMVEKLINAKDCVMTVVFTKKPTLETVEKALKSGIQADGDQVFLSDKVNLRKLTQEMVTGEEREITCILSEYDGQLGRSSVIDLNLPLTDSKNNASNIRLIDHRTIQSVILRNIKYTKK